MIQQFKLMCLATALTTLMLGCGRTDPTEAILNDAQAGLEKALDAWTRGESADRFEGVDPDWKAGYRLQSFLTADAKMVDGKSGHVRCRVALTLSDRKGKSVDKNVDYLVQLGNPLSIRREEKK